MSHSGTCFWFLFLALARFAFLRPRCLSTNLLLSTGSIRMGSSGQERGPIRTPTNRRLLSRPMIHSPSTSYIHRRPTRLHTYLHLVHPFLSILYHLPWSLLFFSGFVTSCCSAIPFVSCPSFHTLSLSRILLHPLSLSPFSVFK